MNTGKFKIFGSLGIFVILGVVAVIGFIMYLSYSNSERQLFNRFAQKTEQRTAFYDKMWKTFNQKGQVAVKNDSSFQRNIQIIMSGRQDAPNVFMKWITETNPNANYSEVSALYKDLSRAIEAEREGFYQREIEMQSIKLEHDNLLSIAPGAWFLSSRERLKYKPITSDRTDGVIQSGKDNDTKVF